MFKNKINIVLIFLVAIIMIISLRYGSSVTDWWESLVYGKQMDLVSLIYFACYAGIILCVFMKYQGK
ncbi:MAG: hypothetical protein IKS69_05070 [Erysipelotrichaceae bacterium]|nr:hypothetical protein [Erysipelotrichaceae bacterium]